MDPTIALYKEPYLFNKNLLDQILRISPETSTEERNNRITNAIQALSSTCFFGLELLAASPVDRAWTLYIYGTDIIAHLAQAYLTQNSHPIWKTTVLGLNILRLGSIWSTVTNATNITYHPGKILLLAFHAVDTFSHGKNAVETTKMLWNDVKSIPNKNPC